MGAAIRHMITQFSKLEEPYLTDEARRRRKRKQKGNDDEMWYSEDVGTELGERADFYDMEYRPTGLKERFRWIRNKEHVMSLFTRVQRIQLRRIAMQTTEMGK
jgi:hypothetical protein